jgi:Ca2+-binding RTX toxin-like protein
MKGRFGRLLHPILRHDALSGGDGNDSLTGGSGNDTLEGGAGYDRFDFAEDSGQDTINDFTRGEDLIDVSGYTNIVFADLVLDTTTDPGNTVIDLGLANSGEPGFMSSRCRTWST